MEQIINTFLDNENLTDQNSLTHLLDFDDEFSDLKNTVETSRYYSSADIIQKIESNSCTVMSINCQSLNAKFSKIKLLIDTLQNMVSQSKYSVFKKHGLKTQI